MRRFVFRLALALGYTVKDLLLSLDSVELSEWIAFDRIEPLPEPWLQTGMVCALTANAWGSGGKSYSPEDFMPIEKPKQSVNQMRASLRAAQKLGG